jgi:hypothetical protein
MQDEEEDLVPRQVVGERDDRDQADAHPVQEAAATLEHADLAEEPVLRPGGIERVHREMDPSPAPPDRRTDLDARRSAEAAPAYLPSGPASGASTVGRGCAGSTT